MLKLLKREFLQSIHDPRRLLFLLGAGVTYLIVFGTLYEPNIVTNIPTVILDDDNSKISREFINDVEASDTFSVEYFVNSEEEMLNLLQNKNAVAAIEIPKNFNRDVKTGVETSILLMVNGTNIINTSNASSAMMDISADFSNRLAVERTALRTGVSEQRLQKVIAPVQYSLRVLGNPTQGYLKFMVIGLALVAFQQGIIFAVGASVIHEYEHQTEIPALKLIAVKFIYYLSLAIISFSFLAFMFEKFGGIILTASTSRLLIFGAVFCFAVVGLAMFVASLFTNELRFLRGVIMIPVPAFVLSGYTWPSMMVPQWLQWLADVFPLTWFASTVRELFMFGESARYSENLVVLLLMGIIYLTPAIFIYRRKLQRLVPPSSREGASSTGGDISSTASANFSS